MQVTREEKNEIIAEIANHKRLWMAGGRREHVRWLIEKTLEEFKWQRETLGSVYKDDIKRAVRISFKREFGNSILLMVVFAFAWYFIEKWLDERFQCWDR